MKPIKETIEEAIVSEASQVQFRVAFNDFKDAEGLPIGVSILVDRENAEEFKKFLEKEEGNLFAHADGRGVQY
jgi:hypothetical protein